MEYRITITLAEHGSAENSERVLESFLATSPEAGAVVEADTEAGTLSVTYSVEAHDLDELRRVAADIFAGGMTRSELPATHLVDVEVEDVDVAADLKRELQPA
jgi:hypothetical protein